MVYLQQVNAATGSRNRILATDNIDDVQVTSQVNPATDDLSFGELVELAEELLEIDEELQRAKKHKLRIWGKDGYLSKPLGGSIVEREKMTSEAQGSIDTLQSRKEHIERILYLNKDKILASVNPEILRERIEQANLPYAPLGDKPATPIKCNSSTPADDFIPFPVYMVSKFAALQRRITDHLSTILGSQADLISEFKSLFIRGNIASESKLLAQLLVEHKRNNLGIISSAA